MRVGVGRARLRRPGHSSQATSRSLQLQPEQPARGSTRRPPPRLKSSSPPCARDGPRFAKKRKELDAHATRKAAAHSLLAARCPPGTVPWPPRAANPRPRVAQFSPRTARSCVFQERAARPRAGHLLSREGCLFRAAEAQGGSARIRRGRPSYRLAPQHDRGPKVSGK